MAKSEVKTAREPKLRHVSLWIWAYLINLSLQIFRSSWSDTLIFGTFTVVLIFASRTKLNAAILARLRFRYVIEVAILFGGLLLLLEWHTMAIGVIIMLILGLVLMLIWTREYSERAPRDARMKRAELIWIVLAVGLALWEFGANILGILDDTLYSYPTISVLVDPMLDTPGGKALFVSLWLAGGLGLLRLVRQR